METQAEFIVVLVTTVSLDEARRIATALVDERLAGCVQIVGPIESIYRWEGKVQHEEERLLVIKASSNSFEAVAARATELHSYDTPEVIALPITAGTENYLDWLRASTRGS